MAMYWSAGLSGRSHEQRDTGGKKATTILLATAIIHTQADFLRTDPKPAHHLTVQATEKTAPRLRSAPPWAWRLRAFYFRYKLRLHAFESYSQPDGPEINKSFFEVFRKLALGALRRPLGRAVIKHSYGGFFC
ncbi:hypothetical protein ElyMa_002542100 [Elysia marginata]|uniref:Uncharacterized protein n=1 Tax=Elysia marginata TaxID=1093978 RepID=A0AAV4GV71_9GAST|nr:hypothetical protein ElyMa_002542100 [Elysia marginata]